MERIKTYPVIKERRRERLQRRAENALILLFIMFLLLDMNVIIASFWLF